MHNGDLPLTTKRRLKSLFLRRSWQEEFGSLFANEEATPHIYINTVRGHSSVTCDIQRGARIVDLLTSRKEVDLSLVTFSDRHSTLILAAARRRCKAVQALLSRGAHPRPKDHHAIRRVIEAGCISTLEAIHNFKVDLSCVDQHGRGPIHSASTYGHAEIVRWLVRKGLDPNHRDVHGKTPLHEASRRGKLEVIEVLLEPGANPDIRDVEGRLAMEIAWLHGHEHIMDHIRDKAPKYPG